MMREYDARTDQQRVTDWVRKVFTEKEATDVPERSLRTAEEALELAQAVGVDAETLHRLVDYVFSRPMGEPAQEIAGTMVTLYAMANALGVDADAAFETELARIQEPEVIERCQRRQHEKRAALVGLDADFVHALSETRPITGEPKAPYAALDGLSFDGHELTPFELPKKRKSWNP
jgi:NTP pyrophosphatase (non-canonical NTP hydrolase)